MAVRKHRVVVHLDDTELALWQAGADEMGLDLANWARLTLRQSEKARLDAIAEKVAALPMVKPAKPVKLTKAEQAKQDLDEWHAKEHELHDPFPSGQTNFAELRRNCGWCADDERAHELYERAWAAATAKNTGLDIKIPEVQDYYRHVNHERPVNWKWGEPAPK